ncbi:putative lipase/esterase [Actinomadura rubrobrunea]|uniref:Lipase/esterase n=1 Tax=Actinomadura rubrobrunea TaxID=115335 RepID=A0A9W6PYX3_9ACTN|nr:alpha/beta hydrolase [Actinomadura rubrobrunea]GLW66940.1 putative lipase/esterase [Actinomadura rubrobrunea]
MPLDPHVRELLAEDADAPPLESMTLEEARAEIRGVTALQGEPAPMADIRDITVGRNAVPVRLYYPVDRSAPAPVLMWLHGGAWTRGDLDTWDTPLTNLAHRTGAVVASVDYRLAPETRFPGQIDDVLDALAHLTEHAESLGVDGGRVAIGGDSAGANIAAGAALAARDLGVGGPLVAQVLIHPPMDPACATPSGLRYGDDYGMTTAFVRKAWELYLPTPYAADHPYAAPLRARNLTDLPPAIIATAEYDPLRDEGERYGERLAEAGVPVRLRRFDGMIHGFLHHNGRVPASKALPEWLAAELRPWLHP